MDELTTLREAWGDADAPSQDARARARAALLARAAGPARRRRFRLPKIGVGLIAVGAPAVAIAIAVTAVQTFGGTEKNGTPPGVPAGPVINAAQALDRAAEAADSRRFTPPRPDQWIYVETHIRTSVKESGVVTSGPYKTLIRREWERADGKKGANILEGHLRIFDETNQTIPPNDYPTLSSLPTDPDALLRWIDRLNGEKPDSKGEHAIAFETLGVILRENLLPPKIEAAIFRAMKKIPGVTLADKSADAAGHPAIALGRITEGWIHEEVMLDPKTYAYLGERVITIKNHRSEGAVGDKPAPDIYVRKGVLQNLTIRAVAEIVDQPGKS